MKRNRSAAGAGKTLLLAFAASSCVLVVAFLIQWFVYDDWLHQTGPLRIVGTTIASIITFLFTLRWQREVRRSEREMIRRFEMISRMNDRIRNALQAIECLTYLSHPKATDDVKREVQAIDEVLREVLHDAGNSAGVSEPVNDQPAQRASKTSA
jgi:Flp pilus assembly protein TadB